MTNNELNGKKSMFVTPDGQNLLFTFLLVSSLFLLWGFCNGMIDVMDKHFQDELDLSYAQSAWVQFAHYLGYFLMALPAGWLAIKLGYKGGIIAGLLMVAAGGFWFVPATWISQAAKEGTVSNYTAFAAFLFGVCVIASGLTFLETVANPYTTVLGDKKYAATRINLAQSMNGIGWIFGPMVGGAYFYSTNAAGESTGSENLYIPYVGVAIVVLILSAIFYFANMPDIKTEDDYHLDDANAGSKVAEAADRKLNRPLIYLLLVANAAVLCWSVSSIIKLILETTGAGSRLTGVASLIPRPASMEMNPENAVHLVVWAIIGISILIAAILMLRVSRTITHESIWSHPHFSAATLTQFFYVAAQAGIFSFFINYITSQSPSISESWTWGMGPLAEDANFITRWLHGWFEKSGDVIAFSDKGAANLASLGSICFLTGRFTGAGILKKLAAHKVLGLYGLLNLIICGLIFLKLGWLSVFCVFLSYFFMSIMFPTIFALGIFGLGVRAKQASAYIVMAIMGGALMPKVMGAIADRHDFSRGFIVPLLCFVVVALYGFMWPKLSGAENMGAVDVTKGH
jgi:FHS family L-fucose permease-like MFS transporter